MAGQRISFRHLLFRAVLYTAAALVFFHLGWVGLYGRPGTPSPDARHTEVIRWRGGGVTYLTPGQKLAYDVSFWGGFIGIWLTVAIAAGIQALDRRREARGLPKL